MKHAKHKELKKDESHLVPAHFKEEELLAFNYLQATEKNPSGQFVDKKTGLREYSRLGTLIKVPEVRNLFIELARNAESGQPLPPELQQMEDTSPIPETGLPPIPSDFDPEIHQLMEAGEGEDKFLALIPKDIEQLFSQMQGSPHLDPNYGIPQFFKLKNFFKSVVRVGATIAGAMLGGPVGAGLGSGLGNLATGAGLKKSFTRGALAGAAHWGLGKLGMPLPGHGGGSLLGANATSAPVYGPGGNLIAGAGQALPGAAAKGAASAGGGSGLGSALGGNNLLLSGALLGGGYLLNKKGEEKKDKEWEKEEAKNEQKRRDINKYINTPLENKELLYRSPEPTPSDIGREPEDYWGRRRYKTGGVVTSTTGTVLKGRGKGQEDLIKKDVPEYTWINHATFVGHLGDGVTKEGHKEIQRFEKKVAKEILPHYRDELVRKMKEQPLRKVKCALSNGEHETKPLIVGALGHGSFEKGAHVLREITKEVMRHKTSNGHDLPPPAHDLETYYKKVVGH